MSLRVYTKTDTSVRCVGSICPRGRCSSSSCITGPIIHSSFTRWNASICHQFVIKTSATAPLSPQMSKYHGAVAEVVGCLAESEGALLKRGAKGQLGRAQTARDTFLQMLVKLRSSSQPDARLAHRDQAVAKSFEKLVGSGLFPTFGEFFQNKTDFYVLFNFVFGETFTMRPGEEKHRPAVVAAALRSLVSGGKPLLEGLLVQSCGRGGSFPSLVDIKDRCVHLMTDGVLESHVFLAMPLVQALVAVLSMMVTTSGARTEWAAQQVVDLGGAHVDQDLDEMRSDGDLSEVDSSCAAGGVEERGDDSGCGQEVPPAERVIGAEDRAPGVEGMEGLDALEKAAEDEFEEEPSENAASLKSFLTLGGEDHGADPRRNTAESSGTLPNVVVVVASNGGGASGTLSPDERGTSATMLSRLLAHLSHKARAGMRDLRVNVVRVASTVRLFGSLSTQLDPELLLTSSPEGSDEKEQSPPLGHILDLLLRCRHLESPLGSSTTTVGGLRDASSTMEDFAMLELPPPLGPRAFQGFGEELPLATV